MEKCWNFIFRQDVVSGKGATGIAHQDFLFKKISKWNRNVVNIFNTISKKKNSAETKTFRRKCSEGQHVAGSQHNCSPVAGSSATHIDPQPPPPQTIPPTTRSPSPSSLPSFLRGPNPGANPNVHRRGPLPPLRRVLPVVPHLLRLLLALLLRRRHRRRRRR